MLSTAISPYPDTLLLQLWEGGSRLPSPSHGSYCTNDVVDPRYVQHVGDGGHSTTFCRDLKPRRNKGRCKPVAQPGKLKHVYLSDTCVGRQTGTGRPLHLSVLQHQKDLLALKCSCLILAKSVARLERCLWRLYQHDQFWSLAACSHLHATQNCPSAGLRQLD